MHPITTPSTCGRCGGTRLVVVDDGPPRCRTCIFAWGHYAAAISTSTGLHERSRSELEHLDHIALKPGCLLCAATGTAWPRRGA